MLASSEMTYRTVVWVIADVAQLQGHVCVLLDNFVIIVQSRCLAAAFSSQEIIKSFHILLGQILKSAYLAVTEHGFYSDFLSCIRTFREMLLTYAFTHEVNKTLRFRVLF